MKAYSFFLVAFALLIFAGGFDSVADTREAMYIRMLNDDSDAFKEDEDPILVIKLREDGSAYLGFELDESGAILGSVYCDDNGAGWYAPYVDGQTEPTEGVTTIGDPDVDTEIDTPAGLLAGFTLPDSLKVGDSTYPLVGISLELSKYGLDATSFIIPKSVKHLRDNSFRNTTIGQLYILNSAIVIDARTFDRDAGASSGESFGLPEGSGLNPVPVFHLPVGSSLTWDDLAAAANKASADGAEEYYASRLAEDLVVGSKVGGKYYSTLYYGNAFTIETAGVTVKQVTNVNEDDWKATVEEVEYTAGTSIFPANKGLILELGTNPYAVIKDSGSEANIDLGNDKLEGVVTGTSQDRSKDYYVLSTGSHGLGFYVLSSDVDLAACKAYIKVESTLNKPEMITLVEAADEAAGLYAISARTVAADAVYDITGRRVSQTNQPGLYVAGGRRLLVK